MSFSGATLGRPTLTSTSHMDVNFASILDNASLTYWQIDRSGCIAGTKSSSLIVLNRDSLYASAPRIAGSSFIGRRRHVPLRDRRRPSVFQRPVKAAAQMSA
jgi:hypothetical protein